MNNYFEQADGSPIIPNNTCVTCVSASFSSNPEGGIVTPCTTNCTSGCGDACFTNCFGVTCYMNCTAVCINACASNCTGLFFF